MQSEFWDSFSLKFRKLVKSVWLFPLILIFGLLFLTSLRISGTSTGVYSLINGTKDTNFIVEGPRGVRSDEWLVNTQLIVAQANNNYQRVNYNVGDGQDMSILYDVPYKEWSIAFKPQNLAFFILPLEFAFAFKWWLLAILLVLSCYAFFLEVFPNKNLRSALLSLFVGLSPMVFWWYQSATILPLAYGFLIMWILLRLFKAKGRIKKIVYSLFLTYILICFGLILYPPFQISCFIVMGMFMIGWILENYASRVKIKQIVSLWPYFLLTVSLAVFVAGLFYNTRQDVIKIVENTVYPGSRIITAGGPTPLLSFSSFLSPNLQYDTKAASGYLGNQSEASNFIFIAPFLFIPSIYLIYRQRRFKNKWLWGLILINALIVVFLVRMYISLPPLEPVYKLGMLHKVPNTRLLLGIGFAGILQLILMIKALEDIRLKRLEHHALAMIASACGFITMLLIGFYTTHHYPIFITSMFKVTLFAAWISLAIYLLMQKRFTLSLCVLIAFSTFSVYKVNPLYRGLSPDTKSEIITAIKSLPDEGSWVVLDDRLIINFPIMAGRHSLNSVHLYPQFSLWQRLDKSRQYEDVYNRYAHVVYSTDKLMKTQFELKHADMFAVKFDPCGEYLQKYAKYVLSPKPVESSCVKKRTMIDLPTKDFEIYEITLPQA